jgi:lysozyme family protein
VNFDQAFALLTSPEVEGDYSDHKDDPGGKTRFGITEATARRFGYTGDMRELPLELAKRIYLEEYWRPMRCDELPEDVRYAVFDAAVNSGVGQSTLWLQRAAGAKPDGILGPQTLAAAKSTPKLEKKLLAQRLRFLAERHNWPAFGRGWARRIALLMEL